NINFFGRERFAKSERMVSLRRAFLAEQVAGQKLIAAVVAGDVEEVKSLLATGVRVDERFPVINGFNDCHTPLHVACRDGRSEIVSQLINAGANVNAVEPIFGAVPLHKAVYNGHAAITQILVDHPEVYLDAVGATNGYTPLHDAIWHGFAEC